MIPTVRGMPARLPTQYPQQVAGARIAIRCDGGAAAGAGHVGRCRPIALAFRDAGFEPTFVGRLDGLAAWLAESSGLPVSGPSSENPCGVDPTEYDAALVDLYGVPSGEVCELARVLPMATLGEAARCPTAGVLIDYHLDRSEREDGPQLLAGSSYAPVDPRFATIEPSYGTVASVLVTLGGSEIARAYGVPLITTVAAAFPAAELIVAGGLPVPDGVATTRPEGPVMLVDLAREVDLAITASGMTAYELACAGVPFVAVIIADNQVRVGRALELAGVAPVLDGRAGVDSRVLHDIIEDLRPVAVRRSMAEAGRRVIDGHGAARVASGLAERWRLAGG
jgi:UDP-2,4-diacetamido-2,4,6-trideoxy-beta-L-altropyranose hydrolase